MSTTTTTTKTATATATAIVEGNATKVKKAATDTTPKAKKSNIPAADVKNTKPNETPPTDASTPEDSSKQLNEKAQLVQNIKTGLPSFTMDVPVLLELLAKVTAAVTPSANSSLYSSLLMQVSKDTLSIFCKNAETSIRGITDEISVDREGVMLVDAKKFFDILKTMSKDYPISISAEVNKNDSASNAAHASICSGLTSVSLPLVDASDYQYEEIDKDVSYQTIAVDAKCFHTMIQTALPFVAKPNQSVKPATCCCFIRAAENGEFTVVGLDGHRLAIRNANIVQSGSASFECLVPRKTLQDVLSALDKEKPEKLFIQLSERKSKSHYASRANEIIFQTKETIIRSNLVDKESYPAWEKLISMGQNFEEIAISEPTELIETLKRASTLCDIANGADGGKLKSPLVVEIAANYGDTTTLKLYHNSAIHFEETSEMDSMTTGCEVGYRIGFNASLLKSGFTEIAYDSEGLVMQNPFKKGGEVQHFWVKSQCNGVQYQNLILPVRLQAQSK